MTNSEEEFFLLSPNKLFRFVSLEWMKWMNGLKNVLPLWANPTSYRIQSSSYFLICFFKYLSKHTYPHSYMHTYIHMYIQAHRKRLSNLCQNFVT
jgi:hypothetical protein